jgi:hypothetical protein
MDHRLPAAWLSSAPPGTRHPPQRRSLSHVSPARPADTRSRPLPTRPLEIATAILPWLGKRSLRCAVGDRGRADVSWSGSHAGRDDAGLLRQEPSIKRCREPHFLVCGEP